MNTSEHVGFYPGFAIFPSAGKPGFEYGPGVFGPEVEIRRLRDIQPSLLDPECSGPDPVYAIAMDIGKAHHRRLLVERDLLFGAVAYAAGRLGREPVRSQGHVHSVSSRNGWSTPEVYEIWRGAAVIYMQERVEADPGRCYAVRASAGEVVIVPPGWGHATISADPEIPLVFGAWCTRDYGFEYAAVRSRQGLAWYPVIEPSGNMEWIANPAYRKSPLTLKKPGKYEAFGIDNSRPIYTIFENSPDAFSFVPNPELRAADWESFVP